MTQQQENNPLHGITLKAILEQLLDNYGWEELDRRIRINCFHENPSINSSLKFLRKTPWARTKVEELYISTSFGSKKRKHPKLAVFFQEDQIRIFIKKKLCLV